MRILHLIITFFIVSNSFDCLGQHLYQRPKPLKKKEDLERIIGSVSQNLLEKKLRILWVYGYDKHHIAGAHDYVRVKDLMVGLLRKVSNVIVEEVFHFPDVAQFGRADLVVMYLHLPDLKKKQFVNFRNYIEKGGGVVSLHETAIMRPASKGKKLAECLGFAWHEGTSKWGAIFDEINIDNEHEIFKGFPKSLSINDEFYWDLYQEDSVKVLGSVRTGPDGNSDGPVLREKLSKEESPVFWTYEVGQGKVFGTTTGHHTFTYYDPEFRIILFRAMAWAANVKQDAFIPLVFEGITNEKGMVGTTDVMRYWEGKRRE